MKLLSIATGVAYLATSVVAFYDNVERLTTENFGDKVVNDKENAWVVTYYADFCPHCRSFEPEFENAAQQSAHNGQHVRFGAVDVMANRDLTTQYGITRAPTVKVFGQDKHHPEDYLGHRTAGDLSGYLGGVLDLGHSHHVADPAPTHEETQDETKDQEKKDDNQEEKKVEEPAEPAEPAAPEWIYNVDAVVKVVAKAHESRVNDKEEALKQRVAGLTKGANEKIAQVKKTYDDQLKILIQHREEDLNKEITAGKMDISDIKTDHVREIDVLDTEAIETIEGIITANKNGDDLTDYIAGLGKEWFTITWDESNKLDKNAIRQPEPVHVQHIPHAQHYQSAPQSQPNYYQPQYGMSAPAPQAPQRPQMAQNPYGGYMPQEAPQQPYMQAQQPQRYSKPERPQRPQMTGQRPQMPSRDSYRPEVNFQRPSIQQPTVQRPSIQQPSYPQRPQYQSYASPQPQMARGQYGGAW